MNTVISLLTGEAGFSNIEKAFSLSCELKLNSVNVKLVSGVMWWYAYKMVGDVKVVEQNPELSSLQTPNLGMHVLISVGD